MKNFNFGDNLRRIRVQKGISQDSIALAMAISQAKYSRIERSPAVPDKGFVDGVAAYLGVPAQTLLPPGWDYSKQPYKFQRSMSRPAIIAYRLMLALGFFDMARGFCDGAEITSTPSRIAAFVGFQGLAAVFIYYTEKAFMRKVKVFFGFVGGRKG